MQAKPALRSVTRDLESQLVSDVALPVAVVRPDVIVGSNDTEEGRVCVGNIPQNLCGLRYQLSVLRDDVKVPDEECLPVDPVHFLLELRADFTDEGNILLVFPKEFKHLISNCINMLGNRMKLGVVFGKISLEVVSMEGKEAILVQSPPEIIHTTLGSLLHVWLLNQPRSKKNDRNNG